jgi:DNA-binding TFAR19-related protein (PDSD5 family)
MTGEEDLELKRLQLRKMIKLASQLAGGQASQAEAKQSREPTPLEVVKANLGPKGDVVLEAALEQYPREIMRIVERLAELIKAGAVAGPIDGGELYSLFRQLGLRVKLDTKIVYVKRGGGEGPAGAFQAVVPHYLFEKAANVSSCVHRADKVCFRASLRQPLDASTAQRGYPYSRDLLQACIRQKGYVTSLPP